MGVPLWLMITLPMKPLISMNTLPKLAHPPGTAMIVSLIFLLMLRFSRNEEAHLIRNGYILPDEPHSVSFLSRRRFYFFLPCPQENYPRAPICRFRLFLPHWSTQCAPPWKRSSARLTLPPPNETDVRVCSMPVIFSSSFCCPPQSKYQLFPRVTKDTFPFPLFLSGRLTLPLVRIG